MNRRTSGFTMLELIMVVLIIGALASLAVPQYAYLINKSMAVEAINYIGFIKNAQLAYASAQANESFAMNMEVLGLKNRTPLWFYETYGPNAAAFAVSAERMTSRNQHLDSFIWFAYFRNGTAYFYGDHPGTPGGPTE